MSLNRHFVHFSCAGRRIRLPRSQSLGLLDLTVTDTLQISAVIHVRQEHPGLPAAHLDDSQQYQYEAAAGEVSGVDYNIAS